MKAPDSMRSPTFFLCLLYGCLLGFTLHSHAQGEARSVDITWSENETERTLSEERRETRRYHDDAQRPLYDKLGINKLCENASIPRCENGREPEAVNTGFCNRYVCPGAKADTCPSRAQPICKEGFKLVGGTDKKGCPKATCEKLTTSCMQPICKEGFSLVGTGKTNSAGCPIMECKRTACPEYDMPLCKSTETLTYEKDKNGCKKPVCQANCPMYQKPLCEGGKIIMEKDKYGCERPTCQRTDTSCMKPICAEGYTLETSPNDVLVNGCPVTKCVKKKETSTSCMKPICAEGYTLETSPNDVLVNGCPVTKCVKKKETSTSCMKPICAEGYTLMTRPDDKGPNGCPVTECVKKKETSTSCMKPICAEGYTLMTSPNDTSSSGCPVTKCVKTKETSVSCAQTICRDGFTPVYVGKNSAGCPVHKCSPGISPNLVR